MNYEDATKELDEIIEKLENGNLGLKESTELFEKGSEILKFCAKSFKEVDGKITIIKNGVEELFEGNN